MRRSTLSGLFGFFALLLALTADRHLVAAPAQGHIQGFPGPILILSQAFAAPAHADGNRSVPVLIQLDISDRI